MSVANCCYRSVLLFLAVTFSAAGSTLAAVIVGGSELLSAAEVEPLETKLRQGPTRSAKVYAEETGDDSLDFYAAAILGPRKHLDYSRLVIGGYNPQTWNTSGGPFVAPFDPDRTAFPFDLRSGEFPRQKLRTLASGASVYDGGINGRPLGRGIFIGSFLYRTSPLPDSILIGDAPGVEVLSTNSVVPLGLAVPEPTSVLAWAVIPIGAAFVFLRRRRASAG